MTSWNLKGNGYEFCNCAFGCGCNFGGFPTSQDGSCRAMVGLHITEGRCGDVTLNNIKCAAIVDWPKAIHEGGGKAVFIVEPSTTDELLAQKGLYYAMWRQQIGEKRPGQIDAGRLTPALSG